MITLEIWQCSPVGVLKTGCVIFHVQIFFSIIFFFSLKLVFGCIIRILVNYHSV